MVLIDNYLCCHKMQNALRDIEQPVEITKKNDVYGKGVLILKWRRGGISILVLRFCPWCGKEQKQAITCALRNKLASLAENKYLPVFEDNFNFEQDTPPELRYLLHTTDWWEKKKEEYLQEHGINNDLKEDIEEDVPIVYRSNIRTFGILKTKKFSLKETLESIKITKERLDFVPINYCYQCGAKFPERLDEKLTEILQKEYGLTSWKDYKKAPPEFHTDEWWVKRGL